MKARRAGVEILWLDENRYAVTIEHAHQSVSNRPSVSALLPETAVSMRSIV